MVLVCATSVSGQSRKGKTRSKAKTERAMTEFEKWQKEEYLAYIYSQFEDWYNSARALESRGHSNKDYINQRYRKAEIEKEYYEAVKNSNYYVDFNDYKQKYYTGGHKIDIKIFSGEGAIHYNNVNEWTSAEEVRLADELVDRINKEIGFDKEKVISERKSSLKEFAESHSGVKLKEITSHPTKLEMEKANNDACKKHKEEAYGKYYTK